MTDAVEWVDCKATLLVRLQTAVDTSAKVATPRSSIKLPEDIAFKAKGLDLSEIHMHIGYNERKKNPAACVTDNMQQDSVAFEGWAMVIKTRVPGVTRIELFWDSRVDPHNRHYQRFLYRVHKFTELFHPWFTASGNFRNHMRIDLESRGKYSLNVPNPNRGKKKKTDRKPKKGESEREVERQFVRVWPLRQSLMKVASLDVIGNQLPVGLFDGKVSGEKGKAIFTGQASAIDLWGVDAQRRVLSVFELKLGNNRKVGIISELFFYAMVMRDLADGCFVFGCSKAEDVDPWPPDHITTEIKAIRAYVLSPTIHPLINAEVLQTMTAAAKSNGMDIIFNHISYDLKESTCGHGGAWHDA